MTCGNHELTPGLRPKQGAAAEPRVAQRCRGSSPRGRRRCSVSGRWTSGLPDKARRRVGLRTYGTSAIPTASWRHVSRCGANAAEGGSHLPQGVQGPGGKVGHD